MGSLQLFIYKVWNKLRGKLAPGQFPIASFIRHPKFQEVITVTSYDNWVEKDMITV